MVHQRGEQEPHLPAVDEATTAAWRVASLHAIIVPYSRTFCSHCFVSARSQFAEDCLIFTSCSIDLAFAPPFTISSNIRSIKRQGKVISCRSSFCLLVLFPRENIFVDRLLPYGMNMSESNTPWRRCKPIARVDGIQCYCMIVGLSHLRTIPVSMIMSFLICLFLILSSCEFEPWAS